jgi:hypothetical protein
VRQQKGEGQPFAAANCQPPTANYSDGVALEEREQQQLCEQQQVGEGMALLG